LIIFFYENNSVEINKVNELELIDSLPLYGKECVVAGGYIHDICNGLIPHDIDIWIFSEEALEKVLMYLHNKFKNNKYHIFPSVIEIEREEGIKIQLINVIDHHKGISISTIISNEDGTIIDINSSRFDVIAKFDFDYVRCMYLNKKIYCTSNCIKSWTDRIIRFSGHGTNIIKTDRLIKAFDKNYHMSYKLFMSLCRINVKYEEELFIKKLPSEFIQPVCDDGEFYKITTTNDITKVSYLIHVCYIHNALKNINAGDYMNGLILPNNKFTFPMDVLINKKYTAIYSSDELFFDNLRKKYIENESVKKNIITEEHDFETEEEKPMKKVVNRRVKRSKIVAESSDSE
jgi:hypothetical protein